MLPLLLKVSDGAGRAVPKPVLAEGWLCAVAVQLQLSSHKMQLMQPMSPLVPDVQEDSSLHRAFERTKEQGRGRLHRDAAGFEGCPDAHLSPAPESCSALKSPVVLSFASSYC